MVMSGLSRVPVLADVLPAILVFLGGFFALLVQTGLRERRLAAFTMPVFALMIFVGDQIGAQKELDFERVLANQAWQNLPTNLLDAIQMQR